ncbi:MAG TPA: class I SAM-dependent methyltransferase [Ktedonobacterales bacterium]|nr:class I SAM-dependent methyltransferase [Ktedonobacterales bacterium]
MIFSAWVEPLLGKQYRCPTGLLGQIVGSKMIRQHAPETAWTIALLDIKPADRILEIGFGAGRAIELIAARTPQGAVAGIDLSPTMVQASRRRNAQAINAGRVDLRLGTVERVPFHDQHFDKLFSIHSLYFWPEPLLAIAEMARVLRPGGRLALTFSPGKVNEQPNAYIQQTVEHLITAMQRLGFTSTDLASGPHSRQFQTAALIGVKGAGG